MQDPKFKHPSLLSLLWMIRSRNFTSCVIRARTRNYCSKYDLLQKALLSCLYGKPDMHDIFPLDRTPLSCIITGGPAPTLRSVNNMKQKTWRILTFADAIPMTTRPKFPHTQLPPTNRDLELPTTFPPRWFCQFFS
jgi:hypothetical protein